MWQESARSASFSFGITVASVWLLQQLGSRIPKALDRPDELLKPHKRPVPMLGGIGILAGVALAGLITGSGAKLNRVVGISATFCVVGLLDDFWNLGPKLRLCLEALSATVAIALGIRIRTIVLPELFSSDFQLIWQILLTYLCFLGAVNSVNLLDGMDGLAAGVGLMAFAFLGLLSHLMHGNVYQAIIWAGALLGFLVWNFHPAKIFMGDNGSMLLGSGLATAICMATLANTSILYLGGLVTICGVPFIDTLVAIIRRKALGKPLFSGDRSHLYDLVHDQLGLEVRTTVCLFYLGGILFGLAGLGVCLLE